MAEQATYASSVKTAAGHGRAFFQSTVGAHPVAAGLSIAVLVLGVVILGYYTWHYRGLLKKNNIETLIGGNFATGSNLPIWQGGSADAGNWGTVHRSITPHQYAHIGPRTMAGTQRVQGYGRSEYLTSPLQGCPAGQVAVTYKDPNDPSGATQTYCQPKSDPLPGWMSEINQGRGCGSWGPGATSEAQALATVGALPHDSFGEAALQRGIDAAYDTSAGLSEAQLTALLTHGGGM